jgi:hypothetical protein
MRSKRRIFFDVLLFISVFFLPWWISLGLITVGIFIFDLYYESLIAAFIMDGLYSLFGVSFLSTFPMTVGVSALFLVSFLVKEHFSFNHNL